MMDTARAGQDQLDTPANPRFEMSPEACALANEDLVGREQQAGVLAGTWRRWARSWRWQRHIVFVLL